MGLALGELARRIGGVLRGDPDCRVETVATLQSAGGTAVSFLADPRYRRHLGTTRAGAVILAEADAGECPTAAIVVADPYVAYARAAALLHPPGRAQRGIHPRAVIGSGCDIDAAAWIGPQCILGDRVRVAAGARLEGGCFVGEDCRIARDARIGPRVTVCRGVHIGERVIIHAGAVIGDDGFGQADTGDGWLKVPQLGGVRIGDDVEIGANTTVDRGSLDDTVIEDGVKLDDQVHVAHNVHIGSHTVIAGCTGICGSTRIGRHCRIGGGAGILGHLEIADGVTVTAMSLVTKSITRAGTFSSSMPARENSAWNRSVAGLRRLGEETRLRRRRGAPAKPRE